MLNLSPVLSTHDLSTEAGLKAYLVDTPFAASSVLQVTGGMSSYTFRVALVSPYKDEKLGTFHSVVIKHARNYAAGIESLGPITLTRRDVEIAALDLIATLPFVGSKVHLPRVLASDSINALTILGDVGKLPTLKEYILTRAQSSPDTSVPITQEIGQLLGEFLANLHRWGYTVLNSGDTLLLDPFKHNEASGTSKIAAWRMSIPVTDFAHKYPSTTNACDWEAFKTKYAAYILEPEDTFLMGDFWSGNILVKLSPDGTQLERLFVLDWEGAALGMAAVDVAQFTAEAWLLQRHPERHEPGKALVSSFVQSYEASIRKGDEGATFAAKFFDPTAIATCTGAHAAMWGILGAWEGIPQERKEEVNQAALHICADTTRGVFEGKGWEGLSRIWEG
ncbi:hypothetical protein M408DRAFT_326205 [Serendipita vermifera MAFF 305830]|uniref:Aminoglycoside phosphotransferase domain-containing protein n=1 Tax=Serendipita vermifera MAFF 305830 TaxID=933852 RepID=A0A0C3BN33_SERVB|nr:hypothetical protein M408DRAFT_326205 [Serendipita vermifera MAFF 305830]